jgi:triacylglycerol esterase/lipase EstA (alpha/beta hydrolase family)
MSHRLNITISADQYAFLTNEADRSSLSIAELVRRAIDTVFGPHGERKIVLISHSTGRRPGRHIA